MPQYKDGTEVVVGDLVRGTGYNVCNPDGTPKVIFGVVVDVTPNATFCNLKVAHLVVGERLPYLAEPYARHFVPGPGVLLVHLEGGENCVITAATEYGQADHFEKVG